MKSLLKIVIALIVLFGLFSSSLLTQEISEKEFYSNTILDSIEVTVSPNFRPWPGDTVTQSEFSADVHPQNENIIFFSANTTSWPPDSGEIDIYSVVVYWSFDGGINWVGHDDPPYGRTGVDPAVMIDTSGNFYVNFIDTKTNGAQGIAVSFDSGANWVRDTVVAPTGVFNDKNHLMIDKSPTSPFTNRLYCGWQLLGEIHATYSTDYGSTWDSPLNINNALPTHQAGGVNLQTAVNGNVYAAYSLYAGDGNSNEDAIGFSKSDDGGNSWTSDIIYSFPNFGIKGHLKPSQINSNSFPSMAVDKSGGAYNGRIYICWTQKDGPPAGTDPDIVLTRSLDGGITWVPLVRVNDDPINNGMDQYFPWMTVDQATGNVMIVFYDSRESSVNFMTGVWMAVSTDGGSTWQNFKVSQESFLPKPITGAWSAGYQGDYIGIAALNNVAYPVWADDRTGNYQAWMSIVRFGPATSIDVPDESTPQEFVLKQNYPNPFNPSTTIAFELPKASNVEIVIYDALGKKIKTLSNSVYKPGNNSVYWDGTNDMGQPVATGVYFYIFKVKAIDGSKELFNKSSKLLLLR